MAAAAAPAAAPGGPGRPTGPLKDMQQQVGQAASTDKRLQELSSEVLGKARLTERSTQAPRQELLAETADPWTQDSRLHQHHQPPPLESSLAVAAEGGGGGGGGGDGGGGCDD